MGKESAGDWRVGLVLNHVGSEDKVKNLDFVPSVMRSH